MPGTAEHRMIGYPILDAELTKPPICQIDLNLRAQLPLRADRGHVAHNQHPDHQYRVDRRPTGVRVVGHKLLVHPTKVQNTVDLAHQMVGWHYLVESKAIKELALSAFPPTHHDPPPPMPSQPNGIIDRESSQWVFCNTIIPKATKSLRRSTLRVASNVSSQPKYDAEDRI